MPIRSDLRHVVYALSHALDLVGVDDVAHGKRVGIMAAECGRALRLPRDETAFLFDLGLLHDIGVSSTSVHRCLVAEFDWEGSQEHAIAGCRLLEGFAPLARMAAPVRYHHTRWDRMAAAGVDPAIARQANLILLVDRVDALMAPRYAGGGALFHTQEVRAAIGARAGAYFDPTLVDAFLDASRSEAFWLMLEPASIESCLQDMLLQGEPYEATTRELKQLATIFSRIVDAKSRFTADHSLGVARLARLLGEKLGLGPETCEKLEIAGLLHDLGKLRVPDEILDKPGALDADERIVINTHSFETYQILRNIPGFEDIARWAAYHHEEPDGSGYPFHLAGDTIPVEARILRVADIFQAMVQDRPYRKGLASADVLAFVRRLVDAGRLDATIAAAIAQDVDAAMAAARGAPGSATRR